MNVFTMLMWLDGKISVCKGVVIANCFDIFSLFIAYIIA